MTNHQESECILIAHEGMETAQTMLDEAQGRKDLILWSMIYNIYRILYLILIGGKKNER